MGNKIIPYGYRRVDGEMVIEPYEAAVIRRIYTEHISGNGIRVIAHILEKEGLHYKGKTTWRGNTINGLMSNNVYTGATGLPKIIEPEIYDRSMALKKQRLKKGNTATRETVELRKMVVCEHCGVILARTAQTYKGKRTEYWRCKNPECRPLGYVLTSEMLEKAVMETIGMATATEMKVQPIIQYQPNNSIIKKEKEIAQMMDSTQSDHERIREEMLALAEMKYDSCTYDDTKQTLEMLKSMSKKYRNGSADAAEYIRMCIISVSVNREGQLKITLKGGMRFSADIERK